MEWVHRMLCFALVIGGLCIYLPKLGFFSNDFIKLFPEVIQSPLSYVHNTISKGSNVSNATSYTKKSWTVFTVKKLSKYTNEDIGLYLAFLGRVYDVSKGSRHYGAKGAYHFFTGKDASRAFVTGDFSKTGLTDNIEGLGTDELISLEKWLQFYKTEYKFKGRLVGRYYDKRGRSTPYNNRLRQLMKEAKYNKEKEQEIKMAHPPCNAEWSVDTGSRVWCTTMSGGFERDWVGVPRQLYDPGSHEYHCACIRENKLEAYIGKIKEYADCAPDASSCKVVT